MTVLGRAVLCILAVSHFGTAQRGGTPVQRGPGVSNAETTYAGVTLPSQNVCGLRIARFKRIISGSDAALGWFPWIAVLGYKNNRQSNLLWLCTGSLVTDRHVITAALCLVNSRYVLSVARSGDLDLNDSVVDNATPTDYEVDSAIRHPEFNMNTKANNIAVVRLKRKVTFTTLTLPICLPIEDELRRKSFTDYYADVTGWRENNAGGQSTTRLQTTNLKVWDQQECKNMYSMRGTVIDNGVVCAGGSNKSACSGDIGNPLMVRYTKYSAALPRPLVNYYLYGIVSHGYRCGSNYPGVYTRVSEFTDWILRYLK